MGCFQIHDFIRGTTIALPRAMVGQSDNHEGCDILRPNREATTLVLRHVAALEALNTELRPEIEKTVKETVSQKLIADVVNRIWDKAASDRGW